MLNNDQYYIVHSDSSNNYPMLSGRMIPKIRYELLDEYRNKDGSSKSINNQYRCKLAPEIYEYEINVAEPKPNNPEFVDYHTYDLEQSVSTKFVTAFEQTKFPGIQFLKGTKGNVIDELKLDYYYLHCLQLIACMDKEKSNADLSSRGRIISYTKLVLDNDVLNKIPLEQRLIFWLREDLMTCVVHQKFVDVYNEADLKGARFVPIEQYNVEAAFV